MFRWSQGLLLHQGIVDCSRAIILLPLGKLICILVSDMFEKTYLTLEIRVMCRDFQTLDTYLPFFRNKSDDYLFFVHQKSSKVAFKKSFSLLNIHLFVQVENTKWILCSQKIGLKCAQLMYKQFSSALASLQLFIKSSIYK